MNHAPLLVLLCGLLVLLSACQTPRSGLTWTSAPAPPPQENATDAPAREQAAHAPRLELIDRMPRQNPSTLPAPLTGANKPGSIMLRFRRVVPEATPAFVSREMEGLDLFIADRTPDGWLAFYKGDCGTLGDVCAYRALLFGEDGTRRWDLDLNRFLRGDRYVELQDVRYDDGSLFFNEACATYSAEVQGQCSWLVRLDPILGDVIWRSPARTSNNVFLPHDGLVIAGYGFTGEPDALYLLDQETGRIEAQAELDSAHQYLEVHEDRLYVVTYESVYTFAL